MPPKTPAAISATLTILILIILAIVFVLFQMLALNGASERQGATAMGIALACQSIVVISLGAFAARVTDFLITKIGWDRILAVIITVIVMTSIGGAISFLASIIAIPVAGMR
jgi:membrane protease YdiL (CAAX protease family)